MAHVVQTGFRYAYEVTPNPPAASYHRIKSKAASNPTVQLPVVPMKLLHIPDST